MTMVKILAGGAGLAALASVGFRDRPVQPRQPGWRPGAACGAAVLGSGRGPAQDPRLWRGQRNRHGRCSDRDSRRCGKEVRARPRYRHQRRPGSWLAQSAPWALPRLRRPT